MWYIISTFGPHDSRNWNINATVIIFIILFVLNTEQTFRSELRTFSMWLWNESGERTHSDCITDVIHIGNVFIS